MPMGTRITATRIKFFNHKYCKGNLWCLGYERACPKSWTVNAFNLGESFTLNCIVNYNKIENKTDC